MLRTILCFILLIIFANAQDKEPITAEDYKRAEKFLGTNTNPLVHEVITNSSWLNDGRLLYRRTIDQGHEFIVVDPNKSEKKEAFNHKSLAEAITEFTGKKYSATKLPFRNFKLSEKKGTIEFSIRGKKYQCDLSSYKVTLKEEKTEIGRYSRLSPDGKKVAFIRDYNLWVRFLDTKKEKQLTNDGIKDFGYATNNAGWIKSKVPVLAWSPNSDKIATFQHDGRGVGEMYLVSTNVGHPKLEAWKYPLPGDEKIFRIERVVVHLDGKVVRLKMPPDAHRSTTTDHIADWSGNILDLQWSEDGNELSFVSSSRDHKDATLRITDPKAGNVRDVLEEKTKTFYESGYNQENWSVLNKSNEVIWYSKRDNWGHLYLYDLATGKLKQQITSGEWNVLQVIHTDMDQRKIYFIGSCREKGDPYFQYFYSINMDGSDLKLLSPEHGNHSISLSDDKMYFLDSYSTPVKEPISVLRDINGNKILDLEKADITKLIDYGWQAPIPFIVKARDNKTDIYGLMYKPSNFDPSKSYPVLNYLYPGPQTGSVGSRSFRASRSDKQAVSELGFIVIEVDAMGTPGRSKAFHDAYYGDMGDNGLPDQIAAIKQMAQRYKWIDASRVGIWGHSGGGFASTAAMLRYPDFYDVAVSSSGNHDNRNYEDDWGEKWHGLLEKNADGTDNYDKQANHLLAKNLKGKLLLAHGMMDNNVPPSNTLLVVEALMKANKDFDLLVFPNRRHGYGPDSVYFMRRRWDYFVRHLLGVEPPKEFEFTSFKRRN
jgi:dipeptidyl aminopeptidase/acylaminoacyl peptidase